MKMEEKDSCIVTKTVRETDKKRVRIELSQIWRKIWWKTEDDMKLSGWYEEGYEDVERYRER